jgi:hypothetical protein
VADVEIGFLDTDGDGVHGIIFSLTRFLDANRYHFA